MAFVFTITQLTSLLAEDPTALGVARTVLVFGPVWWMYEGYVGPRVTPFSRPHSFSSRRDEGYD